MPVVVRGRVRGRNINCKESDPELVEADVVILATGFNKPSVDFFKEADEIFPEGYQVRASGRLFDY